MVKGPDYHLVMDPLMPGTLCDGCANFRQSPSKPTFALSEYASSKAGRACFELQAGLPSPILCSTNHPLGMHRP